MISGSKLGRPPGLWEAGAVPAPHSCPPRYMIGAHAQTCLRPSSAAAPSRVAMCQGGASPSFLGAALSLLAHMKARGTDCRAWGGKSHLALFHEV